MNKSRVYLGEHLVETEYNKVTKMITYRIDGIHYPEIISMTPFIDDDLYRDPRLPNWLPSPWNHGVYDVVHFGVQFELREHKSLKQVATEKLELVRIFQEIKTPEGAKFILNYLHNQELTTPFRVPIEENLLQFLEKDDMLFIESIKEELLHYYVMRKSTATIRARFQDLLRRFIEQTDPLTISETFLAYVIKIES